MIRSKNKSFSKERIYETTIWALTRSMVKRIANGVSKKKTLILWKVEY